MEQQKSTVKRGRKRANADTYLSRQQQYLIALMIGTFTEPLKARIEELTARVEELERALAPAPQQDLPELKDIDLDSFLVDTSTW
jgi:Mg2+ and Co2+ transporter CorA